jgi:hypothetical protein
MLCIPFLPEIYSVESLSSAFLASAMGDCFCFFLSLIRFPDILLVRVA